MPIARPRKFVGTVDKQADYRKNKNARDKRNEALAELMRLAIKSAKDHGIIQDTETDELNEAKSLTDFLLGLVPEQHDTQRATALTK